MTATRVTPATATRPRIERLLEAQRRLRQHARLNAGPLFEVERAIESLAAGQPTSTSDAVEAWVNAWLGSPAGAA